MARSSLSTECIRICNCAQKKLQQMYHNVTSGKVTRYDLIVINNHLEHVRKSVISIRANEQQFMTEKQRRKFEFEKFTAFSEQFQLFKGCLPCSNNIEGKSCTQRTDAMYINVISTIDVIYT